MYSEQMLERIASPKHRGIKECNVVGSKKSKTCNDSLKVGLTLSECKVIEGIRFEHSGCALSLGSIETICEIIEGKNVEEAQEKLLGMLRELGSKGQCDCFDIRNIPHRANCVVMPISLVLSLLM